MSHESLRKQLNHAFRQAIPDDVDLWPRVRLQVSSQPPLSAQKKRTGGPAPRSQHSAQPHAMVNRPKNAPPWGSLTRQTVLAGLAIGAALALVFSVSPTVRAMVVDAIRRIGGIDFVEQQQVEPVGNARIAESQVIQLSEVQAQMPFTILVPTWVPEGYAFDGNVLLPSIEFGVPHVALNWLNGQGGLISLGMIQTEGVGPWSVGEGSLGEVEINGQSAAVVAGGRYNESGQWVPSDEVIDLMWYTDGVLYTLSAYGSEPLSIDDLIRVAESLQPLQP